MIAAAVTLLIEHLENVFVRLMFREFVGNYYLQALSLFGHSSLMSDWKLVVQHVIVLYIDQWMLIALIVVIVKDLQNFFKN